MTKEEIIRNLKYTMKKHKNDTVNTFDTNISVMCKDILDYFEEQEPCEDAISREDVMDWLENATYEDVCEAIGTNLDFLPSVTHKSGKWIGIDEKPHEDYECSCCGYVVSTFTANIEPHTEYKYCPNCGAKMESEDKE